MVQARPSAWMRRIKLLAGLLVLMGLGLLVVRCVLYAHTWRGRFERIRLGMSEAEALRILGPTGDFSTTTEGSVVRAESYTLQDGREVVTIDEGKNAKYAELYALLKTGVTLRLSHIRLQGDDRVRLADGLSDSEPPLHARWTTNDAIIHLDLDDQRRVTGKVWLQYGRPSGWQRFLRWLGLQN